MRFLADLAAGLLNAPLSTRGRASFRRPAAITVNGQPLAAETNAERLERFLPDVRLIGPDAGAELRRAVHGEEA